MNKLAITVLTIALVGAAAPTAAVAADATAQKTKHAFKLFAVRGQTYDLTAADEGAQIAPKLWVNPVMTKQIAETRDHANFPVMYLMPGRALGGF